uniref:Retrotrans_gag domain-containing protein n=1 Tax=Toxocara canis TaxID=6265 RepID=A0A183TWX4_TOXCA
MIDSEDLRAVLEAQEERQRQMLKAVLETANQQQQALLASPASAAEFITNSLSTTLPEFIYDPDNGCTFDVWINRYEDVIVQDSSSLDEAAKARLIVSKLDTAAYARFTNRILPKRASELCFDDTVKTLKELFVHNMSVFARRYTYLRTQRNGESLSDYTGMVNRRHEMAEFNAITPKQMKCLVWICGLHTPDDADIRTRAVRKMEDNPQTTLRELSLEIQQFLNIRRDAKLLGTRSQCSCHQEELYSCPHPAFDVEDHIGRETATSSIRRATIANSSVTRRAGHCKNSTNKKKRNRKNSRATSNVVVIGSTGTDVAPVNRIFRKVKVNDATI